MSTQESGFTLLELVISVTILALIMGIIFGAMRLGSKSWEVEDKRVDALQRMRVTYDILFEDIKSIVCELKKDICPEKKGCPQQAFLFIGEHRRIKFVSSNSGLDRRLSKSRYRIVTYYLGQEFGSEYKGVVIEEGKWLFPDFFRFDALCDMCDTESGELDYDVYTNVLYPDVTDLTFRYYGKRDTDADPDWYETWNSMEDLCTCDPGHIQKTLPEKVEIKMVRPSSAEEKSGAEQEEVVFEVTLSCDHTQ